MVVKSKWSAIWLMISVSVLWSGAAQSCTATGSLVFYTSQLEKDAKALVNGFKSLCPSVETSWVRTSTSQLLQVVMTELEIGKVHADVLMVSNVLHLLPLKLNRRLAALPQIDVTGLLPGSYDLDRMYFGTKLITTVIVGQAGDGADELPKSWLEFEAAAKNHKVSLPDPDRSILAGNHISGILSLDSLGWRHLESLAQSGVSPMSGIGESMASVLDGRAAFGVGADFLALNMNQSGDHLSIAFPQDGSIAITEPIAVMEGTKNPDAAIAFVDFVLKPNAQKMVRAHGFIPVLESVPAPDGFPDRKSIKFVIPDEGVVLREMRANQQRLHETFD